LKKAVKPPQRLQVAWVKAPFLWRSCDHNRVI